MPQQGTKPQFFDAQVSFVEDCLFHVMLFPSTNAQAPLILIKTTYSAQDFDCVTNAFI